MPSEIEAAVEHLTSDPAFLSLGPADREEVRSRFMREEVLLSKEFNAADLNEKRRLSALVFGQTPPPAEPSVFSRIGSAASAVAAHPVTQGLAGKVGLEAGTPGLLESFGGPPGSDVDRMIRALAVPYEALRSGAKDITEIGGAALGRLGGALGLAGPEAGVRAETPVSRFVGDVASLAVPFGMQRAALGRKPLSLKPPTDIGGETVGAVPPGPRPQLALPPVGGTGAAEGPPRLFEVEPSPPTAFTPSTRALLSPRARELQPTGRSRIPEPKPQPVGPLAVTTQMSSEARGKLPAAVLEATEAAAPLGTIPSTGVTPRTLWMRLLYNDLFGNSALGPWIGGLPPRQMLRGVAGPDGSPVGQKMVAAMEWGADTSRGIEAWFKKQVNTIYAPLKGNVTSEHRVNKFLDGDLAVAASLDATERQVAIQARALLDLAADSLGLEKGRRVTNYFHRLREQSVVTETLNIQITKDKYIPKQVMEAIPKEYHPAFLKERKIKDPAAILDVSPLYAYAKGLGRKLVWDGGRNPITGEAIPSLRQELTRLFPALPKSEGLQHYVADWVNDSMGLIGRSMTGRELAATRGAQMAAKMEFARTLGLNAVSAVLNFFQSNNVFARASTGAYTGAWKDMLGPTTRNRLIEMGRQENIFGAFTKADIDLLDHAASISRSRPVMSFLDAMTKTAGAFAQSERIVRLHAFAAGLRDATKKGITGRDAIEYARDLVSTTQFRFGPESKAPGFRRSILFAQFKNYPLNQTLFIKDLVTDATKGDMMPLVKWLTLNTAMFGSDAVFMGLDKMIARKFSDQEGYLPKLVQQGFFPTLGVFIGNQIGLGVIPATDFQAMLFFLPGPFASHVADVASAVSGSELNPFSNPETVGKELSPEQRARKIVRSFPVAGIAADRLRRMYVESLTPNKIITPQTLSEAFGLEVPTGAFVRPQGDLAFWIGGLGFSSPEKQASIERQQREVDLLEKQRETLRKMSGLVVAGKHAEAEALRLQFKKDYKIDVFVTRPAAKAAAIRQIVPTEERRVLRAPKTARERLRKIMESE